MDLSLSSSGPGMAYYTDEEEWDSSSPMKGDRKLPQEVIEILEDLSSRFIVNLPEEELESIERICFHLEAAHWFYEDFFRENNPKLPYFSLKEFVKQMFLNCPILRPHLQRQSIEQILANFTHYKVRVPVCGAIILNTTMDKILLVKGWSSRSGWGFPKGKINQNESEADCAAREVFEETSLEVRPLIHEEDSIDTMVREQKIKLYIVAGIPEDTPVQPRTRKEISKIQWIPIDELPNAFAKESLTSSGSKTYWMVIPFINKVKKWISRKKKGSKRGFTPKRDRSHERQRSNSDFASPGNLAGRSFKVEDTDDIDMPAPGNLLNKIIQAVQTFETPNKTDTQPSFSSLTPDYNAQESPMAQELPKPVLLDELKPPSAQKRLFAESSLDRKDQPLASPLQYSNDPWLRFKFDYQEIAKCFVYN